MLLNPPFIVNESIEWYINNQPINTEAGCVASYNPGFNKIDIKLSLTDIAISYCEVRVTDINDDYDIGVGNLPLKTLYGSGSSADAFWLGLAANTTHNLTFYITPERFPLLEGQHARTFRIAFYAKNELDGSWNVSYLVFTLDGSQLVLQDGTALGVLTTKDFPNK